MIRLTLIISAIFIYSFAYSQEGPCGTQVTPGQKTLENTINLTRAKPNESLQQINKEMSVTVYIIKDENGNQGITQTAINLAFDQLNLAFSPINLKFKICNTNIIDNYQFNLLNALQNENDLITQFNSPNTVNLYFASQLTDQLGNAVSGYTYMPASQKDAIFLTKSTIAGKDLIHQFGHFFGLYHTHETVFGKELVNDPNCNKTGDRCCDTPADPSIGGLLDDKCDYTGNAKDEAGKFYIPATNNLMSAGNGDCRCIFTRDQYNRIIYTLQNQKKHLW